MTVNGSTVTVEFGSVGPATFTCQLDFWRSFSCESRIYPHIYSYSSPINRVKMYGVQVNMYTGSHGLSKAFMITFMATIAGL